MYMLIFKFTCIFFNPIPITFKNLRKFGVCLLKKNHQNPRRGAKYRVIPQGFEPRTFR